MMEMTQAFYDFPSAYTSFEQIPEDFRFYTYKDQFAGRDVWSEYIEDQHSQEVSDGYTQQLQLVEQSWKLFCEEQGCHHALASPTVIHRWCEKLLENRSLHTVGKGYLRVLNTFYRYLMWNVEYPHIYNPVQFAAEEFDTVSQVEERFRSSNNE